MKALIDTHILLWTLSEPEKLSAEIYDFINSEYNSTLVSSASLHEIAIKKSIGKLNIKENFFHTLEPSGFEILNISPEHFETFIKIPAFHKDPFDRMLVAQSISENIPLITKDRDLLRYQFPRF